MAIWEGRLRIWESREEFWRQVLPTVLDDDELREGVQAIIKEEVMKLGSPAGGLELIVGIYPPTPPENLDALLSALEEFRTYWVGK